ncbi:MAG TPA: UDP-N-acetylmuramoyl-L-alanine--D-glutamate ligase [Planctomycetota bacterium]|nr:UDP-N-acetylmuramoyl-L-alanine--D-glutamate ligase [Planctomycetota bacterium]
MRKPTPAFEPMPYKGKRVTVVCLGLFGGGLGVTRYLAELGAQITVTDRRKPEILQASIDALKDLSVRYVIGKHEPADFTDTDLVVINPAVHPDSEIVQWARGANVPITSEIKLVLELCKGTVVAVTGSNGKSTTTAMIGSILKAHDADTLVGGNLGGSLLATLAPFRSSRAGGCEAPVVLELSSFQLEWLKRIGFPRPFDVAVFTTLTPNHLDWHKDFADYAQAKFQLLRNQTDQGHCILNADDAWVARFRHMAPGHPWLFSTRKAPDPGTVGGGVCHGWIQHVSAGRTTKLANLADLQLAGEHNLQNAIAACLATFAAGVSTDAIRAGLRAFGGLPHRLEKVGEGWNGEKFINDSIATTPESTLRALESYKDPITLIAGGSDKGLDYADLGQAILHSTVRQVILMGVTGPKIAAAIRAAESAAKAHAAEGATPPAMPTIVEVDSMEAAVTWAFADLHPKDVVLMSPASASFDMFANFEQRGEVFRREVLKRLPAKAESAA